MMHTKKGGYSTFIQLQANLYIIVLSNTICALLQHQYQIYTRVTSSLFTKDFKSVRTTSIEAKHKDIRRLVGYVLKIEVYHLPKTLLFSKFVSVEKG